MAARQHLDRTPWELQAERGLRTSTLLYHIGVAVQRACGIDDEDDAHQLVADAFADSRPHTPIGAALAAAGIDTHTVARQLRQVRDEQAARAREREHEMFREALR
jgi:hypothetical protein